MQMSYRAFKHDKQASLQRVLLSGYRSGGKF